jgi:hypothetical protein
MKKIHLPMLAGALMLTTGTLPAQDAKPVPAPAPIPVAYDPATKDAAIAAGLKAKLETSEKAWQKMREACKGNYEYDIRFQSWVGFSNTTTIVVKDNQVVGRKYQQRSNRPMPSKPPEPGKAAEKPDDGTSSWEEKTADELGKHKEGAPAKTIDQLYKEAAELLGKGVNEESQRWLTLFHKDGVIQYFGWSDKRIMDDAPFNGARIDAVRPATK